MQRGSNKNIGTKTLLELNLKDKSGFKNMFENIIKSIFSRENIQNVNTAVRFGFVAGCMATSLEP